MWSDLLKRYRGLGKNDDLWHLAVLLRHLINATKEKQQTQTTLLLLVNPEVFVRRENDDFRCSFSISRIEMKDNYPF